MLVSLPRALVALLLLSIGCAPLIASFDLGGDEAKSFALAVSSGETRRAYDLLCPAVRFGVPFEAFRDAVDANPFLLAATDVTIQRYESVGGLAVVQSGWITSTSGVADARFHLSKIDEAWCLTGVEIGGTPALPVPGTSSAASVPPPAAAHEPDRARLAAPLRNAAYRAYGLANPGTRRYRMTGGDAGEGATGVERAELTSLGSGSARFKVIRAGALAALGSVEVSLEADGIYLIGSSEGSLEDRTLILPAKLDPGASWQSDYLLTSPGGEAMHYRGSDVVEGRETVRTPAGEFDTLRVVSNATIDSGETHGTVRTTAWYADGIGSVRAESETTIAGKTTRIVIELLESGTGGH